MIKKLFLIILFYFFYSFSDLSVLLLSLFLRKYFCVIYRLLLSIHCRALLILNTQIVSYYLSKYSPAQHSNASRSP